MLKGRWIFDERLALFYIAFGVGLMNYGEIDQIECTIRPCHDHRKFDHWVDGDISIGKYLSRKAGVKPGQYDHY